MSVLKCNRRLCTNIMCDRLSDKHGYICHECFEELVNTGPETNIASFMISARPNESLEEAEARYNIAFPKVHEE